MPLHLLGKKSWNVYNADNIARVRRDEAEAKAKEEAEEQRMQDHDAKRRLAILRGEAPPPYEEPESAGVDGGLSGVSEQAGLGYGGYHKERKKRKRAGEDDTEFELRVARGRASRDEGVRKATTSSSAPLVGRDGHIDLIGDEKAYRHAEKNPEAEKEAAHVRKEYEDQFRMRFSNAAGKDQLGKNPWYTSTDAKIEVEPPSKNVWGNEDPLRKQREAARLVSNDPLAMMKAGAAKVREVRRARESAQLEREEELKKLEKEQRRRERHARREERRHRHRGEDGHHSRERHRRRERSREREAEGRRRTSSSPRRDRGHRDHRDRDERRRTERRRD